MGSPLSPWEAQAVMTLSNAYQGAIAEYNRKQAKAPWNNPEDFDRSIVAAQVKTAFRR